MLYYIPDRRKLYADIQRVLKPGGRLYAATNGQLSMRQYDELVDEFAPGYRQARESHRGDLFEGHFYLENGYCELAESFSAVVERRYDDALVVTEAEPLVAYVESSGHHLSDQALANLRRRVEAVIASEGAFQIDKVAGVLIATKEG
jgi:SAM-dependent methyltransferase